jgi:hypothetical protein
MRKGFLLSVCVTLPVFLNPCAMAEEAEAIGDTDSRDFAPKFNRSSLTNAATGAARPRRSI